jgi:ubiquinone/menaquinone biosynthesis C-methylase UbiE
MGMQTNSDNEQMVAAAFNAQSVIFDEQYSGNRIIQYKRGRVRDCLIKYLKPDSRILELNAGTGEDSIFLAQQGHHVHATDISAGMQFKLKEKLEGLHLRGSVSQELCSYTALSAIKNKGPYDCIFSNFAGLNCTDQLDRVFPEFDNLLKPGGIVLLVILPKFCLWEILMVFKGKFKTAGRRFFSSKGRKANIDGASFTCWYYSPGFVKRALGKKFKLLDIEGLCSLVPPSYIENFPEKYPRVYAYLCRAENYLKSHWPWKYCGDYYIISFKKK